MKKMGNILVTALMVVCLMPAVAANAAQSSPTDTPPAITMDFDGETTITTFPAERAYHIERLAIGLLGLAILAMVLAWAFGRYRTATMNQEDVLRAARQPKEVSGEPANSTVGSPL